MEGFDRYIEGVSSGAVLVGEEIRLAVQRHYALCENEKYFFDRVAANRAIKFFDFLSLSKGAKGGTGFILEDWQQFIVGSIFGWMRKDTGFRLYKEAYVEVAKKNGKTTLASGVALYMLLLDKENGADVFVAAYSREQATICFGEAKNMLSKSKILLDTLKIKLFRNNINVPSTFSQMFAVSNEANNTEGKNAHCTILDEYHVHKTDKVKNSLATGSIARKQPLLFIITTAGTSRTSPCYYHRTNLLKVLKGQAELDGVFISIFALDPDDNWQDERVWYKANPNLNVSVNLHALREEYKAALLSGTKEADFKTKHLNQWVDSADIWIRDRDWQECEDVEKKYLESSGPEVRKYGGIDIATTQDYCAFSVFWEFEKKFYCRVFYWICERQYEERKLRLPSLMDWRKNGWLRVLPGNSVDLEAVREDIERISEEMGVDMIAFDRYKADAMIQQLIVNMGETYDVDNKSVNRVLAFGQNIGNMSAPTKELERLVIEKKLLHDGSPLTRWMVGNVTLKRDHNENVKPDREESTEKIDGVIAMVEALAMWLNNNFEQSKYSTYDSVEPLLVI